MLAQGILKGQKSSKNHKMLLFVSWGNKFLVIECPPFDAPKSTHSVFTSFSLSRCCCLHFCRNKFGLMLAQGYFKGQRSSIFTYCNFLWPCVICNHWVATIWCAIKYPRCLYFIGLSKCCFLHFCRNKFGLLLVQGYFKGQRSRIYHKLQLFMTLCDMQSSSGNYSMRHQVSMVFLLLLIYLGAVTCISEERNLGQCWRKDILRVKGQA